MQIGEHWQPPLGAESRAADEHQRGGLLGHVNLTRIGVAQLVLLVHGAQRPGLVGHQHVLELRLQFKVIPASVLGEIILVRLVVEAVQFVDGHCPRDRNVGL